MSDVNAAVKTVRCSKCSAVLVKGKLTSGIATIECRCGHTNYIYAEKKKEHRALVSTLRA